MNMERSCTALRRSLTGSATGLKPGAGSNTAIDCARMPSIGSKRSWRDLKRSESYLIDAEPRRSNCTSKIDVQSIGAGQRLASFNFTYRLADFPAFCSLAFNHLKNATPLEGLR
jgi:hypothetical protein